MPPRPPLLVPPQRRRVPPRGYQGDAVRLHAGAAEGLPHTASGQRRGGHEAPAPPAEGEGVRAETGTTATATATTAIATAKRWAVGLTPLAERHDGAGGHITDGGPFS